MEINIKDNGKMIRFAGKVFYNCQMGINVKAFGKISNFKEKPFIIKLMAKFLKEHGLMKLNVTNTKIK